MTDQLAKKHHLEIRAAFYATATAAALGCQLKRVRGSLHQRRAQKVRRAFMGKAALDGLPMHAIADEFRVTRATVRGAVEAWRK